MERGKKRRETAGESQCQNNSDGVSQSENERQEKTLKAMCFIDSKKSRQAHLLDRLPPPPHLRSHLVEIN